MRLVAGIEEELGVSLTISMLINGEATVRGLASQLTSVVPVPAERRSAARSRAPEIVRLNPDGDLTPLIVFFPSGGSLLALRHLRSSFDERQPVIGLLSGLDDQARFPRDASVSTIARDALATLDELQPAGAPYRLAGYSVAGLIAYEVAGLLLAEGANVQWLGLIDTYSPVQATRELSVALYLQRSRQRNLRASVDSALARVRTESVVVGSDLAARIRRRPLDRFDELGARRLISGYTPAGHEVPLHLLLTRDSAEKGAPMLGWSELHRGQVVVHHVEGDHMSIMQGDAAGRLGKTLAEALTSTA